MIGSVHSHLGPPELAIMLGLSLFVFKPEWTAACAANPRPAAAGILGLLLTLGFMAFAHGRL